MSVQTFVLVITVQVFHRSFYIQVASTSLWQKKLEIFNVFCILLSSNARYNSPVR